MNNAKNSCRWLFNDKETMNPEPHFTYKLLFIYSFIYLLYI